MVRSHPYEFINFAILEAVKFAQEVLQDILNNIQNQNVDAIIRQAEDILEEIAARDFSNDDFTATDEYELANDSMYTLFSLLY